MKLYLLKLQKYIFFVGNWINKPRYRKFPKYLRWTGLSTSDCRILVLISGPYYIHLKSLLNSRQKHILIKRKKEKTSLVYPWAPNYCCKIAFVYKVWLYHFSLNVPCPGGVRHTAWLRADRTLCSARPILSFPAKDLSIKITAEAVGAHLKTAMHTELRWHCDIFASIHVQICVYGHTLIRAVSISVILPDYVAGLGEAARHKEAFDDVDFLIHGLRQVGGNWDSETKSEQRQNAKRLRSPASINSTFKSKTGRKRCSDCHEKALIAQKIPDMRRIISVRLKKKITLFPLSRQTKMMCPLPDLTDGTEQKLKRYKKIFAKDCFPLMKMLFSGSPSFHSCWQFPSISWTRPLLLDWPAGTSSVGCYESSRPQGPNLLFLEPLPWFCPIVALEMNARH